MMMSRQSMHSYQITHLYFTIGLSYLPQLPKTILYHLTSHLPTIERQLLAFRYFYFIYPRIHRNKKLIYVLFKKKNNSRNKKNIIEYYPMTKDNEPKFEIWEKSMYRGKTYVFCFKTSLQFSVYIEYLIFCTFPLKCSQTNRLSFLSTHKPKG